MAARATSASTGSASTSRWRRWCARTKQGQAWLGGKKLTDAAQIKKWVDKAYDDFLGDSLWLVGPFRILDPGVELGYEDVGGGPGGEFCDIIKVDLPKVAATAGGRLWLYVDRKSHLVVESKLRRDGSFAPPSAWSWSDWQKRGPILVASTRKRLDRPIVIRFDKVVVSETPDEAALTPPK